MSRRKISRPVVEKFEEKFTFKSYLSGEQVSYNIILLQRKEAAKTQVRALRTVLGPFGKIDGVSGAAFLKAIDGLDDDWFEAFWALGKTLLNQAIVNGDEIDFEEYYGRRLPELCQAVAHALLLNYPDVFTRAQLALAGMRARALKFVDSYQLGDDAPKYAREALETLRGILKSPEEADEAETGTEVEGGSQKTV